MFPPLSAKPGMEKFAGGATGEGGREQGRRGSQSGRSDESVRNFVPQNAHMARDPKRASRW